jgi:hypothetical protein
MLGNYFYHQRIRKAVASFGSLFDSIYVVRQNSGGETISQVKVPLSYAPKRSYLERINQTLNGEEQERMVAIKLPRMSFEITGMSIDPSRQLNKMNVLSRASTSSADIRNKVRQPVPYILNFQLSVYAKSQDDALQIVEQILPTFSPKYNITIKPFAAYTDIKEDVPITLNSVGMEDSYEGPLDQRRTIIYTLDFTMDVNFYGNIEDSGDIIREVNVDLGTTSGGVDTKQINLSTVPNPLDAVPEDDYGFTETTTEY